MESRRIQEIERKARESVAAVEYADPMSVVAEWHSIGVMDTEVERFLAHVPPNGHVLDIGGGWGWHWRHIATQRRDVTVVLADFVAANFAHAHRILGKLTGQAVQLVNADGTNLPLRDRSVDAVWSVQTFQHIPDFRSAVAEAYRVLRPGGWFTSYSLAQTPLLRLAYRARGKPLHVEGVAANGYWLARASDQQQDLVRQFFGNAIDRYTECLFHPEFRMRHLAALDRRLSGRNPLARFLARQRSVEAVKR